ncbi:MAG TPA: hypothetical protein VHQ66_15405 [Myxococcota bacterium]|nr:hypothetical protein [Myxococcota bacterium]
MRKPALLATLTLAATLGAAGPASADEYDPQEAGHPLRLFAYVLHPVGVAFDYLVFRPAHWVGHHEPLRTIFGHDTEY